MIDSIFPTQWLTWKLVCAENMINKSKLTSFKLLSPIKCCQKIFLSSQINFTIRPYQKAPLRTITTHKLNKPKCLRSYKAKSRDISKGVNQKIQRHRLLSIKNKPSINPSQNPLKYYPSNPLLSKKTEFFHINVINIPKSHIEYKHTTITK